IVRTLSGTACRRRAHALPHGGQSSDGAAVRFCVGPTRQFKAMGDESRSVYGRVQAARTPNTMNVELPKDSLGTVKNLIMSPIRSIWIASTNSDARGNPLMWGHSAGSCSPSIRGKSNMDRDAAHLEASASCCSYMCCDRLGRQLRCSSTS